MHAQRQIRALSGSMREDLGMRIEGEPGEALSTAYLWLTRAEAAEMRDALNDLLNLPAEEAEGWHSHVSSADFQTDVAIAVDQG